MTEQIKAKEFSEVAWEITKMLAPNDVAFSEIASNFLGGIIEVQKDEPDETLKIWLDEAVKKAVKERENW